MRRIREKYVESTEMDECGPGEDCLPDTDVSGLGSGPDLTSQDGDGSTIGLMGWIQTTDLNKFAIRALIVAFLIILLSIILHHFLGVKKIKKF